MNKIRKKFDFEHLNINVRFLIVILLTVDLLILGVLLVRRKPVVEKPIAVITPTPEATASAEPEPTPEIERNSLLSLPYHKTAYTAENLTEHFTSEWELLAHEPAYAETSNTYDTQTVSISATGDSLSSVAISRGGIPFYSGVTYTVFLNISSSLPRKVGVTAHNWDSGAAFGSTTLDVNETMNYYEWSFTPNSTTYNGGLSIDLGNNGITDPHTVVIQGTRIVGDDSNAAVRTSQVGYYTDEQKQCTFIYSSGDLFDVVNQETGNIAYSGAIVGKTENPDTGEVNYYGDFTNLREPGTYFIRSQTGVISHTFTISDDPFVELRRATLRMLSYQRCGEDLGEWADGMSHPACHTGHSNFYLTDVLKDTTGGWHDAGDYGRYVKTGTKSVNDLLLAYMNVPELFDDANEGPDSGNGIPDILDEARYELEWLLKMQEEGGGFFVKATTMSFPDDFMAPENDLEQLYLLAPDTIATADAVGSLAIASRTFQEIDAEFAKQCLEAAKKGESYLSSHSEMSATMNPMGFSTGQYLDDGDLDARFTAEMALYTATADAGYLQKAKDIYNTGESVVNSTLWNNNGMYGAYLFLSTEGANEVDPEFYNELLNVLDSMAAEIVNVTNITPYHVANGVYAWGSNSTIANNGIVLSMAYDFTGKQEYYQTAMEQVNYLLGKNSLDMCFISGFGTNYPKSQHNRLSLSKNTVEIGFLSGGPDASREDKIAEQLPADTPPAKIYVDDYRSYSTNEIAIYYNSALLYLLTTLAS